MPSEDDRVRQLLQLFPGGDPIYFRECLRYYREDQVAHVVEKVVANHYYPRTTHAEMNSMEHLNDVLHTLATEIFPDCDIGYLRDLVEKYNHSHLEQVALEVISQPNYPERLNYGEFDRIYTIRKPHYQHQTLEQLSKEFPHIWKSSIRAMLTEHHWDYISTREALKHFQRPGFTKSIHTLCEHWIGAFFESQAGSTTMRQALNPVLANEMEQVRRQEEVPRINDQVARDQQLALRWNTEQYEKKGQLITCLCCIDEYTFEEMAYCSEGNHAFCHDCITRFVSEKMFGQGALNNELRLPCICMDGCSGWISQETLERVVPDDIWRAYEKFMFERNLQQLRLRIVQCKSCNYCELDDTIAPLHVGVQRGQRLLRKVQWTMVAPVLALGFYSPPILVAGGLLAASCWMIARQWDPSNDLKEAYEQILFQRRGTAFRCGNPECRKLTCLQCHREMRGIHKCRENNVDNLRLYVERAMDNAIKRTCPECGLSFQKEAGCNKMTCNCGHMMCYVCRKDVRREQYTHFCQHPRDPGSLGCDQCNKCDLWQTERDDAVAKRAGEKARRDYLQAHPELQHAAEDLPQGIGNDIVGNLVKMRKWFHRTRITLLRYILNKLV